MLSDISKKEWLSSPEEFEGLSASLGLLAKDIAQVLLRNYGIEWRWVIQPDQMGGVITIFASKISMKYGYIIKIADIENDPHRKEAIKGGGEILERFGMPRGKFHPDLMARLRYGLDFQPKPDILDSDSGLLRKQRDKDLTKAMQDGTAQLETKDVVEEDGSVTRHVALGVLGKEE